ncbi:hypothetical protein M378DRAFT_93315, partial [Amanita muscaria Koide BX008]
VIHVDDNSSFIYHILEVGIHHSLEQHDSWFEKSSRHNKCGFPFISFLDSYIVVSLSKI